MTKVLTQITGFLMGVALPEAARWCRYPLRAFAPVDKSPRDAVLVLDASPSMTDADWPPSRLAGAQKAAKAFVDRLRQSEPGARVAVVAYSASAVVLLPLSPVCDARSIACCIDSIQTRSATNITAGLNTARGVLRGARTNQQVVLLTDGAHNHGPGPAWAARLLRTHAVLECVGIGGCPTDVDETLLKDIASVYESGRKRYRWIGDSDQLVRHFEDLAGGLTRE